MLQRPRAVSGCGGAQVAAVGSGLAGIACVATVAAVAGITRLGSGIARVGSLLRLGLGTGVPSCRAVDIGQTLGALGCSAGDGQTGCTGSACLITGQHAVTVGNLGTDQLQRLAALGGRLGTTKHFHHVTTHAQFADVAFTDQGHQGRQLRLPAGGRMTIDVAQAQAAFDGLAPGAQADGIHPLVAGVVIGHLARQADAARRIMRQRKARRTGQLDHRVARGGLVRLIIVLGGHHRFPGRNGRACLAVGHDIGGCPVRAGNAGRRCGSLVLRSIVLRDRGRPAVIRRAGALDIGLPGGAPPFLALRRSGCLGSLPAQRQLDGFRMRVAGGGGKLLLRLGLGIALALLHAEQRQQQNEQQQDAHFQRGEAAHGLGRMQWRR